MNLETRYYEDADIEEYKSIAFFHHLTIEKQK